MREKPKKRSGASMMEIMMALVVAATLAAVATPNWQKATEKKKADRALAALMTISECIKQYKVEYQLGALPTMTYSNLASYGCLSLDDIPREAFRFPLATDTIAGSGSVIIPSNDNSRMVCVTNIGNLEASTPAYFFDAPYGGSCIESLSGYYRKISESEIGKQRGS